MRALIVAARDRGGSLYHLARELRRRGRWQTRLCTMHDPAALELPTDVAEVFDGGEELAGLVREAEIVHLVDLLPEEVAPCGLSIAERLASPRAPKLVLQCDAVPGRLRARKLLEAAAAHGAPILCTASARLLPGATFLPPFLPHWQAPYRPLGAGARMRAATASLIAIASTPHKPGAEPELEALADRTAELLRASGRGKVESIHGRPQRSVLQRRRHAHLVLAAPAAALDREMLEALCQGVAVVARTADEQALETYAELAGGKRPPIWSPESLERLVDRLGTTDDPDPSLAAWAREVLEPIRWFSAIDRAWGSG